MKTESLKLTARGPVTVKVIRNGETVVLGTAGGANQMLVGKYITIGPEANENTREYGPITEVRGDSGLQFELDLNIAYTDGPASSSCPVSDSISDQMMYCRF